jgi:hypothetical protein
MRFTISSSFPNPIQFFPSVLGGVVSLPRLLDENEDDSEDGKLCWVIILVRTVPLLKRKE